MSCDSSSVGKGSPTGSRKLAAGPVVDLADASPCGCENRVVPDLGKVMDGSSSPVSYDSQYAVQSGFPVEIITARHPTTELWMGRGQKAPKGRRCLVTQQVGKFVLYI